MKKKMCLVCSIVLLIIFTACSVVEKNDSVNAKHNIFEQDQANYIQISTVPTKDEENIEYSVPFGIAVSYPQFTSIADMKQRIENQDIPENQLASLPEGTLESCNLDVLYDATFPLGITTDYILWYGDSYSFQFKESSFTGYLNYCNENIFNMEYERNYINYLDDKQIIISDENLDDRNAREIHFQNSVGKFKTVSYAIDTSSGITYVRELYALEYFDAANSTQNISEIVPQSIYFFGTEDTVHFHGWVMGFEERPTVEWLSAFGLQEYVETEVS